MLADRIEGKWIDAFCEMFVRCGVKRGRHAPRSCRRRNRGRSTCTSPSWRCCGSASRPFHIVVPTPRNPHPVAGALDRRQRGDRRPRARWSRRSAQAGFIVDCTHRRPDARAGDAGDPQVRRAHPATSPTSIPRRWSDCVRTMGWKRACARRQECCADRSA